MRKTQLHRADIPTLLEWFIQAAIEHLEAGLDWRKANARLKILVQIRDELRSRGTEAFGELQTLLEHPNPAVRYAAAITTPTLDRARAQAVLEELESSSDREARIQAFVTLQIWRRSPTEPPSSPGNEETPSAGTSHE